MSDAFDAQFNEDKSEPAVTPAATEGQPRDEGGRFASQQPAEPAPATPEPVAAQPIAPIAPVAPQPEPPKAEQGHIPISALLDEREKRQALQKRLDALEAQQPRNVPSVTEDPEAFAAYQQQLVQQTATNTRFETSELVARQQHGDDPVQKAMDWAMQRSQESPAFAAEYLKQKHPIGWAVRQQKRYVLLDEIGDDPEAYKAKLLASHSAAVAPSQAQATAPVTPQPAPVQPKTPAPSPSLASAPSAGGPATVPVGNGIAFEGVFQR